MNMRGDPPHDPNHEHLLERWATGDELTEGQLERIRECPRCRERCTEIEAVAGELEQLGSKQLESELQQARDAEIPPWEERVAAALELQIARDTEAAPNANRSAPETGQAVRHGRALAAAALLLVAFVWQTWPHGERSTPNDSGDSSGELWLGSGISGLTPVGPWKLPELEEFRWEHELESGGYYLLEFLDTAGTRLREVELSEPRWTPDTRALDLPPRFRWRVTAYDALDEQDGTAEAAVFWSPPR